MLNKINKIIIFLVSLVFLSSAFAVSAADFFLFQANKELPNEEVVVSLGLDTNSEKINVVAGELIYDESKLELISFSNANSIVPLWVENPKLTNIGKVSFSGVVPGGFSGVGKVISLVFKSLKPIDDASKYVSVKNLEILRNDGSGQPVVSKQVKPSKNHLSLLRQEMLIDNIAPELFQPILSRKDVLFGGESYLIFNTTDKGSGVEKYFVAESKKKIDIKKIRELDQEMNWNLAESPYRLRDQELKSYLYVKVVDRAGNALVVEYDQAKKIYQLWWFWIIIIVIALGVWLWLKKRNR